MAHFDSPAGSGSLRSTGPLPLGLLLEALEPSQEVRALLEDVADWAWTLRLVPQPRDEWECAAAVHEACLEDPELCEDTFSSKQEAYGVASRLGAALALHEAGTSPCSGSSAAFDGTASHLACRRRLWTW